MDQLILSDKYKDFLKTESKADILEGTTAAGKTTVGVFKFMIKVAKSNRAHHIISGRDLGVIEANIITSELGIKTLFGDLIEYNGKGKGGQNNPHILFHTPNGDKIIYVLGYGDESRWKKVLGGQFGCVYIDEINIASLSYVGQVIMRCDYWMATLNPDNPDKPIYKDYINRARPTEKYKDDAPKEITDMLDSEPEEGWHWWYFSFKHNPWVTESKLKQIKSAHAPGTADYKHYVLGLRGKATGVIFTAFTKKNIVRREKAEKLKDRKSQEHFLFFSCGFDTSYSSNSPDTFALSYIGVTNKGNCYLLDECCFNNKEYQYAPSEIAIKVFEFLDKNKEMWGFCRDIFVDSADQATIMELNKYKKSHGLLYNINNSHKKLKIIDRINIQSGWFASERFFVLEDCKAYQKELAIYSWKDNTVKTEPEDGNDHMINSVQYAWIPYRAQIGT